MPLTDHNSTLLPGTIMRAYAPGDEHQINAAFNDVFRAQRSMDEWYWKFKSVDGQASIHLLIDNNNQHVLSQFCALHVPVQVNGQRMLAGQSVDDFCVRRTDLAFNKSYQKLSRTFHHTCGHPVGPLDFLYGFPGRRHLRLMKHQKVYDPPEAVPYFVKPVKRPGIHLSLMRVELCPDGAVLDDLFRRSQHRYAASAIRDRSWWNRRYADHPANPYIAIEVRRGRHSMAWAVFRQLDTRLVLGDLLWDGQDPAALHAINRWANRHAHHVGCTELAMWLHGDLAARDIFSAIGWRQTPNPLDLAISALRHNQMLPKTLLDSMYFTMGDSDLF